MPVPLPPLNLSANLSKQSSARTGPVSIGGLTVNNATKSSLQDIAILGIIGGIVFAVFRGVKIG